MLWSIGPPVTGYQNSSRPLCKAKFSPHRAMIYVVRKIPAV